MNGHVTFFGLSNHTGNHTIHSQARLLLPLLTHLPAQQTGHHTCYNTAPPYLFYLAANISGCASASLQQRTNTTSPQHSCWLLPGPARV